MTDRMPALHCAKSPTNRRITDNTEVCPRRQKARTDRRPDPPAVVAPQLLEKASTIEEAEDRREVSRLQRQYSLESMDVQQTGGFGVLEGRIVTTEQGGNRDGSQPQLAICQVVDADEELKAVVGFDRVFFLHPSAPKPSMWVDATGNWGNGTATPTESFHLARSDGSAQILIEDTATTPAVRTQFQP